MLPEILQSTNLFYLLHRIDIDLAEQQQAAGCPYCGGTLHYSNYQRKPRGGPDLPDTLFKRLSLCCSNEKCRRRTLPQSILFMDRRIYFRVVILIITTLNQNKLQRYSINMLAKMVDANRKTISRWLTYFRELFPQSKTWKKARGFVSATIATQELPGSLVAFYLKHISSVEQAIINCLGLLTTGFPSVKMMVK